MASLLTVRLDKGSSPNLGFRLQGGKDFGTPLVVQKVNGGSPAERAGLLAGDSVIKVNNTDVFNLRHKDAQDVIVRAGPAFELTIQRGGSVWKPTVIPTGPLQSAAPTVTKTSLAASKNDNIGSIGTGHNVSAKPFGAQLNGAVNGGPKIVNNQYNSPLKLYSEQSIAETLSAQTEVLSTGALGVNFKKNEKNYDATNSAVYRMLQEAEKEPKSPEPEPESGVAPSAITGLRHVSAPENRPPSSNPQLPPGQNICADCERLIVGVFVRIKDKNLHVECFKCSTCGTSLKNVGYYNINNKLYCDVHAKLAARTNPPAPNLVPVTVPPGGKAPASAISSALASHSLPSPSPLSPKSNLAQPFQAGNYSTTPKPFSSVSAPVASQNFNTLPKAAPLSPAASVLAPAPAPTYSPVSSTGRAPPSKPPGSVLKDYKSFNPKPRPFSLVLNSRSVQSFVWPPPPEEPEVPTACPIYIPPSTHLKVNPKIISQQDTEYSDQTSETRDSEFDEINIMAFQQPKLSLCSEEVCGITGRRSAVECVETIYETLETQRLIEDVLKNRPKSPPPLPLSSNIETNHNAVESRKHSATYAESGEACGLRRLTDLKPNTVECKLKSQVENVVPQSWESPMVQALRTVPDSKENYPFTQIAKKFSSSPFASALAIAPSDPFIAQPPTYTQFEPVPLPEETVPYFPPEHPIVSIEKKEPKPEKPESKFVKALQTVPDRPFTPVGSVPRKKEKDPTEEFFKDLPKPQSKLTMREALTIASDRPYTPVSVESVKINDTHQQHVEETTEKRNLQRPTKPTVLPTSFQKPLEEKPRAPKPFPIMVQEKTEEKHEEKQTDMKQSTTVEKHHTQSTVEEAVEHSENDQSQGMYPLFKGFSCSFKNKSEHSQFSIEIDTTPPLIKSSSQSSSVKVSRTGASSESITETMTEASQIQEKTSQQSKEIIVEKQAEQIELKKPLKLSSALHKPEGLPQYQVNIGENVEAEIQMMRKVEAAKLRHEQQKPAVPPPKPPREVQTKPVITIQPGENKLQPGQSFKPVCEERPPSSTFSPRPRPITPSMINKPAPSIPYYQASLVAQEYHAPEINLLDPTSPAISRSPSPCPGGRISPSPFRSAASLAAAAARAKSPAAGPPPNPLISGIPVPTPRTFKVETTKKNLANYLPQHQSRISNIEQFRTQSVENLADGLVQVQRKKTVTEEYEHSQKAGMIQIEKNISTIKSHPFKDMKSLVTEESSTVGMHVTNPQPIVSPFLKKDVSQSVSASQQSFENKQPLIERRHSQLTQKPQPTKQEKPTPIKHVQSPSLNSPIKHVPAPSGSAQKPNQNVNRSNIPVPNAGSGGRQAGAVGVAPKRGRGVLNAAALTGTRIPLCASCHSQIRGPFITALGKIWCPEHFICATPSCRRPLQDLGFVEEQGQLYCEYCFEQYLAPTCAKCNIKIKGDCLKAIGKKFHPECFSCVYCGKLFGNNPFFLEDGNPYCEADWNELFTTKCFACGFPVEAGDRWVEALNNNWHSQCFNCTMCKKNLEGQSFFAKGGRPFCKNHAR